MKRKPRSRGMNISAGCCSFRKGMPLCVLIERLQVLWKEKRYLEIKYAVEKARPELWETPETVEPTVWLFYDNAITRMHEEWRMIGDDA